MKYIVLDGLKYDGQLHNVGSEISLEKLSKAQIARLVANGVVMDAAVYKDTEKAKAEAAKILQEAQKKADQIVVKAENPEPVKQEPAAKKAEGK